MSPEVIAELKAIAARMPCCTEIATGYDPRVCVTCGFRVNPLTSHHIMRGDHAFKAMEPPECGTTTCEKARLEAIADGLLHGADISWLRPWRGAQSPTEARL